MGTKNHLCVLQDKIVNDTPSVFNFFSLLLTVFFIISHNWFCLGKCKYILLFSNLHKKNEYKIWLVWRGLFFHWLDILMFPLNAFVDTCNLNSFDLIVMKSTNIVHEYKIVHTCMLVILNLRQLQSWCNNFLNILLSWFDLSPLFIYELLPFVKLIYSVNSIRKTVWIKLIRNCATEIYQVIVDQSDCKKLFSG